MRAGSKALKFRLERWIQRGAPFQLLFVGGLVVAIAVVGGLAAWLATDDFERPFDAVWWSFLRLTDPGYLGDDQGLVLRVISMLVTVLGYVLFMGSLIAIMTQWLARTLRRLESGLTPITMSGHVVILGWTNRTPELVVKLLGARGRLTRFLQERGLRRLRIVVLTDEVDAERRQALRDYAGELWSETRVFLRSGSALEPEDLQRLDLRRAAVIVVPGADFELGGAELTDTRVIKALLTLWRILAPVPLAERPFVIAEIFDSAKVEIAEKALEGSFEIIASDAVISRLISQSVRHRRLAGVFVELLSHEQGSSLYVRGFPELAGQHPLALGPRFPEAIVLGAIRDEDGHARTHLNPPADFRLEPRDLLVLVARRFEDAVPDPDGALLVPGERRRSPAEAGATRRVLVLGWSYKVGAILTELGSSSAEHFEITLVSRVPVAERERALARTPRGNGNVTLRHVVDDYTVLPACRELELERYDSLIFLASSNMETSEEADARTILGYVLVRSMLEGARRRPEILLELLDPMNSRLFEGESDVLFVSPRILSHLLAHVSLRPELSSVYTALFVAGGAEITLRQASDLGLTGRALTFAEIAEAVLAQGHVALGLLLEGAAPAGGLLLNPERTRRWTLGERDELVLLSDAD